MNTNCCNRPELPQILNEIHAQARKFFTMCLATITKHATLFTILAAQVFLRCSNVPTGELLVRLTYSDKIKCQPCIWSWLTLHALILSRPVLEHARWTLGTVIYCSTLATIFTTAAVWVTCRQWHSHVLHKISKPWTNKYLCIKKEDCQISKLLTSKELNCI